MSKLVDLTGQKFGRLVVIERAPNDVPATNRGAKWLCRCDCGNLKSIDGTELRNGRIKSCGCLHNEVARARRFKHGKSSSKLYKVWEAMKKRCNNPSDKEYHNYGARGIRVSEEWENSYLTFERWAYSNGYIEGLTIDRIDYNGNYCPENCRWTSWIVQGNNKRNNRRIEYNGELITIAQAEKITGIKHTTIISRLNHGWDVDRALTEKPFKGKNQTYKRSESN